MSPIGGIGLPFFKKYHQKSQIENKNFLCIPLCYDVHFSGYVVDVCNKTIVHVDSLWNNNNKNTTSTAIAITLFDDENINFKSYLKRRVQFDSNSCGVWFVAGIASYVNALPLSSGLDDAFDIAYNSVERKAETPVNLSVPTSSNWKFKDHIDYFYSTFLSSCFDGRSTSFWILFRRFTKGICSTCLYITHVNECPIRELIFAWT